MTIEESIYKELLTDSRENDRNKTIFPTLGKWF